ncbi:single-stranded-DNA-specific exonuclease RecJ [Murdochiella vaginalis]|uniref:single-stranded-DNA-specific exonuclease RecJ n=1 Tax=Murdochiella vaginalis TaxID=1852373 RepID=UPI0008FEAE24|nr:single-stranded-DNA-specific exonuclease RecJ [Murdochiella vaginalis]
MRWFLKNNRAAYEELSKKTSLPPLTRLLLANRGVKAEEADAFLHPQEKDFHDPFLFSEMEIVVSYIMESLASDTPIRIIGDYDQDGVAATAILVKGLRYFAEREGKDPITAVSYAIPDRIEDGYGINPSLVAQAEEEGVGLIITVDNGVAAFAGLEEAVARQIPVIVTDHHEPAIVEGEAKRPPCEALLNPKFPGETYPFDSLCGAGIAFKLMQALSRYADVPLPIFDELLSLATLGTICDMMDLKGENRVIVTLGLQALNATTNPGLRALLAANSWNRPVSAYTVGFIIGPCINSSGRLLTARLGVELFLEHDPETVNAYARELYALNEERKAMTREGVEVALSVLEKRPLPQVIVEVLPDVHESLCGLIAGRIKDRFYRPTLIFTPAQVGKKLLKGSGRSVEAYDMFSSLNRHREEYVAFGGHRMACGITIEEEKIDSLRTIWNREANLSASDMEPSIEADGKLSFSGLHVDAMEQLASLAPFGKGNPSPLFAAMGVNVLGLRLVGKNQNVLQARLESQGVPMQAVAFSGDVLLQTMQQSCPDERKSDLVAALRGQPSGLRLDILYCPEWNEYNGRKSIQLKLADMRISAL